MSTNVNPILFVAGFAIKLNPLYFGGRNEY